MKIKVSEATGIVLDWAVAKCEALTPAVSFLDGVVAHPDYSKFYPSKNWAQGGPIIERERIQIRPMRGSEWDAYNGLYGGEGTSSTPLEAAMRCYVASKLGDEVEVPDEIV